MALDGDLGEAGGSNQGGNTRAHRSIKVGDIFQRFNAMPSPDFLGLEEYRYSAGFRGFGYCWELWHNWGYMAICLFLLRSLEVFDCSCRGFSLEKYASLGQPTGGLIREIERPNAGIPVIAQIDGQPGKSPPNLHCLDLNLTRVKLHTAGLSNQARVQ